MKATSSCSDDRPGAQSATETVRRVLVVDDSQTIRAQVGQALRAAGYTVVEAGDGMEALDRLSEQTFLAAIVDVNMPRLNGLDMLDRVKAEGKHEKMAILMLTTEVQQTLVQRAKNAGARCWMIKPVKLELLVSAVDKLTR